MPRAVVLLCSLCACASSQALERNQQSPTVLSSTSVRAEDYGELIYEGKVFSLTGTQPQLFTYERRVQEGVSTNVTRDAKGVVVIQTALHDGDYALKEFTEFQFQVGEVGRLVMHGDVAEFRLTDQTHERVARETVSLPVVVGPTLYGFIKRNWDSLLRGEALFFVFAVPSRLETIGFVLEQVGASVGQLRVRMKPTNPVMALAIEPLFITYTQAGELLSLDGRVPPKLNTADGWVDVDAHVDYVNQAAVFR